MCMRELTEVLVVRSTVGPKTMPRLVVSILLVAQCAATRFKCAIKKARVV